jgi:hypothetical protein
VFFPFLNSTINNSSISNNYNQESNKELSYNNNTNIFNGGFHRSIAITHQNMMLFLESLIIIENPGFPLQKLVKERKER